MMGTQRYGLIVGVIALVGCGDGDKGPEDGPATPAEIDQLVERSLDQLVYVEGGTFEMGDMGTYVTRESYVSGGKFNYVDKDDPDARYLEWTRYDDDKPPHKVTLDSYYISRYETTFSEYDIFTRATGRDLIKPESKKFRGPNLPVKVGWRHANAYCDWLAERSGLPFDLPTEAQWEYAARSRGRPVGFATDTGLPEKGKNIAANELHPVGRWPPNPLGIYDMSGNVEEWVADWYDADYYAHSPRKNPQGPSSGEKKIQRGGSFVNSYQYNDVYHRTEEDPNVEEVNGVRFNTAGLRCAVNVSEPPVDGRPPGSAGAAGQSARR